jgi:gliding motility-associated lipoprotein GldH
MQKKGNFFIASLIILLFLSCDTNVVFDVYKTLPNQWHKDSITSFTFKTPDTINNYNLFVNLRNNNDYRFNNLFLIVALNYANGKVVTDTLEYKMAKPNGELLGTGFTDIKENKLWYKGYKSKFKFSDKGDCKVNIQHAMRKNGEVYGVDNLEGVSEIGFRIEKVN